MKTSWASSSTASPVTRCFSPLFSMRIGFIGNLWVPKSHGLAARRGPGHRAGRRTSGLLALFAVQHSVMARPAFKRWWTRIVPEAGRAQHLCAVLIIGADRPVLALAAHGRRGLGDHRRRRASTLCTRSTPPAGCCCCTSTFLINHFDLFGLRQVWLQLVGRPYTPVPFRTPWLYRQVRHPLYVGWLMIFWATPTMTVAHLVFAVMPPRTSCSRSSSRNTT